MNCRVINPEKSLEMCQIKVVVGVRKHLSWYIMSFGENLFFPLTTLILLEVLPAFKWMTERLGSEDTLLSHACSPVLLEKVSLLFSPHCLEKQSVGR